MNVTETGEKHSQPCQTNKGSPQKDSAEHEGYAGACNFVKMTENNATKATDGGLLEQTLDRDNLNRASYGIRILLQILQKYLHRLYL